MKFQVYIQVVTLEVVGLQEIDLNMGDQKEYIIRAKAIFIRYLEMMGIIHELTLSLSKAIVERGQAKGRHTQSWLPSWVKI